MKQIGIFLYDEVQAVDVAGALDTFGQANAELIKLGRSPAYHLHLIGLKPGLITAENGLKLAVDIGLADSPELDYLVLPGGCGSQTLVDNASLLAWIRTQDEGVQKMLSICTGAFLLAATGLVDGRRVATHWRFTQQLQRMFPAINVNADALYCSDGKYYSSGGMTAGIDLCLSILEQDLGLHLAQVVAQELVMYLRRTGTQSQYSRPLSVQAGPEARFVRLQQWLLDNLHRPVTVSQMAEQACMSERHFRRQFNARFGVTPSGYLEQLRLDRAKSLLMSDGYSLERVCTECGFVNTSSFGRLFKRRFATTPIAFRNHFSR